MSESSPESGLEPDMFLERFAEAVGPDIRAFEVVQRGVRGGGSLLEGAALPTAMGMLCGYMVNVATDGAITRLPIWWSVDTDRPTAYTAGEVLTPVQLEQVCKPGTVALRAMYIKDPDWH